MTDTILKIKKSSVPGRAPTELEYGEVAINYNDGRLYYKSASNNIRNFVDSDIVTNLVDTKLAAAGVGDSAQTVSLIRSNSLDSAEVIPLIDDQSIVFSIALG